MLSTSTIAIYLGGYFILLLLISLITGKKATNQTFYLANRKSPWYLVAFGMIGASLSGVTFISVPGWVQNTSFNYLQMVLGYIFGYFIVAHVLLPKYYELNLTSIYEYLKQRFGTTSYKTGASFFLFSRTLGASFRLYLVANVLHLILFKPLNIPFYIAILVTILLIYLYTFKGGIKTIVWTDAFQTLIMLVAVVFTIMELTTGEQTISYNDIITSEYTKVFNWDGWSNPNSFFKMFLSGIFITIVMTGLDQDMMQKNLSCKSLKDAQKNMKWYGFAFLPMNILFLTLGALLLIKANQLGIELPEKTDQIYPMLATSGVLSKSAGILFILGLAAAAYSSADSALTSLTTSFTIDILDIQRFPDKKSKAIRILSHLGFSLLIFVVILFFHKLNNTAVINSIFVAAGYTYGPLLGIYAFGFFTKFNIKDRLSPYILIIAPFASYGISVLLKHSGYKIGYELLMINGLISFLGLWLIRLSQHSKSE